MFFIMTTKTVYFYFLVKQKIEKFFVFYFIEIPKVVFLGWLGENFSQTKNVPNVAILE